MLIDGQEELALKMLQNQKLIGQLVEWARKQPDMIGVNSESSRLMAWLIKHIYRSRDCVTRVGVEPLKAFAAIDGTVEVLVNMLLSVHIVMQNEALCALTYIVAFLGEQDTAVGTVFIASNIGSTLVDFIQRMSEMERMTNEIVENLNTFVSALGRFEEIKKHLDEHDIQEKVKTIPRIKELATL